MNLCVSTKLRTVKVRRKVYYTEEESVEGGKEGGSEKK